MQKLNPNIQKNLSKELTLMKVYKGMKKNAVISDYYRNLKINAGNEEIHY